MALEYILLIFASVAVTVWWFMRRAANRSSIESDTVDANPLSVQELARLQVDFERHLADDCDLPDSIRGRDAYVYWNLMRKWFDRLSAESRFNDGCARKLQSDWREYFELLPRAKTAQLLAMEAADKAKASAYDQEAKVALRSIEIIQNAFAAAISAEAIEELRYIRSRDYDAFDRTGRKPMAPTGHHYFPTSIRPYIEECRPKHIELPSKRTAQ